MFSVFKMRQRAYHRGYVKGLRVARNFVATFDQEQTDWQEKFDRNTVINLRKGLDAMIKSAKGRKESPGVF